MRKVPTKAIALLLVVLVATFVAGCQESPQKPTCRDDSSSLHGALRDATNAACEAEYAWYQAQEDRSLPRKLADGDKDSWSIVAGALLLVAGIAGIAIGRSKGSNAPSTEAEQPPGQESAFVTPTPESAAGSLMDSDGGCTRARWATVGACAAVGMPDALVLVRVDPRPDGDAEVILELRGITEGTAMSLVKSHLLAAWGVRSVRGIGLSRDGLFQVTVSND
ncbi:MULTISPECIES: hypothetical protein [Mycobacteriaceae]|nr:MULTISPECIES: hypothetical protein [Mycolicibacterium]